MDSASIFLDNLRFRDWVALFGAAAWDATEKSLVRRRRRPLWLLPITAALVMLYFALMTTRAIPWLRFVLLNNLSARTYFDRFLKTNTSADTPSTKINPPPKPAINPLLPSKIIDSTQIVPPQKPVLQIQTKNYQATTGSGRGDEDDDLFLDAQESPHHLKDGTTSAAGNSSSAHSSTTTYSTAESPTPTSPSTAATTASAITYSVQEQNSENTTVSSPAKKRPKYILDYVDILTDGKDVALVPQEKFLTFTSLQSKHPEHQFSSSLDTAVTKVLELEYLMKLQESNRPTKQNWTFEWEKNGIVVHTLAIPDSSIPIVRGKGKITGGFTISEIFSVIRSPTCRKKWDQRFESGTPLFIFNQDETIGHTIQKGSYFVPGRDMIVALTTRRPSHKELIHAVTSVDYKPSTSIDITELLPLPRADNNNLVRANLTVSAWTLKSIFSNDGINGRVDEVIEAVYIVQVDPKGNLPSAIVKLVQNSTPLVIPAVQTYLETNGPVPFILNIPPSSAKTAASLVHGLNPLPATLLPKLETWNADTRTYSLLLSVYRKSTTSRDVAMNQNKNLHKHRHTAGELLRLSIAVPRLAFWTSGCAITAQVIATENNSATTTAAIRAAGAVFVGPGISTNVETRRRNGVLQGIVGDMTMAVVMVWINEDAKNYDDVAAAAVADNTKEIRIKIEMAPAVDEQNSEGAVFFNGSVADTVGGDA
ncbi:hypothetical protein HK100_012299 [Physocladia obscura]|uniref:START domain-containing protein n=1 Tax=Physocladia obscura TaxID=109957 RepID=A0AAD5SZZ5_9FUNG|nr:hypothetical protein HK100_012299 [Physocladia obscura]